MKDMERLLKEIKIIKSDLYASSDINCLGGKELFFQLLQMEYDILLSLREDDEVGELPVGIPICSICKKIKAVLPFKGKDNDGKFQCVECTLLEKQARTGSTC